MKTKSLKITINIGTMDAERLGLGHDRLYMEGDVITVDELVADKMIAARLAKENTPESQKADAQLVERQRESAIQAAMPAAERELAAEDAKAEAIKRLKSGKPASAPSVTPSNIANNPHDPVRKTD